MRSDVYSVMHKVRAFALLGLLFFCASLGAQDQIRKEGSDPLQGTMQRDSSRVQALLEKSGALRGSNPDSAILLSRQAIELADDVGYETGKALGFKSIGIVHFYRGRYDEALEAFERSLAVYEKEKDTNGISNLQNNIGSVYQSKGDDPKALSYFIPSLRNGEIVQDTERIASALLNIGTVYSNDPTTYDLAIENFTRVKGTFEEIGYDIGVAVANVNIGELYLKREEPAMSIPFLREALPGFENGAEAGLDASTPLNFLGEAHLELNELDQAESFFSQALRVAREIKNVSEESKALIGLGDLSNKQGNYPQAVEYYQGGLALAKQTGVLYDQEDAYEGLAEAYSKINNFQSAFDSFKNYFKVYDSIRNENMVRSLGFARVEFEADQTERENELLKTRNTLNEVQIEQAERDQQLLLIILGLFLAIIAGFVFQYFYIRRTNKRLAFERNRSEEILLNILPRETADELKENGFVKTQELDQVTVLFTDFKAFSTIAERISAEELIRSVDYYFKNFDEITERHNIEKIKTIGDAYMCAGGLPQANQTHAHDAFRAALDILRFVKETELNPPKGIYPFRIRIGLNTGPVVSGVVGTRKFAYDIWGNTVNIAARMESGSVPGRINVSENTHKLLKDDYDFTYRGEVEVKNGLILKMYFAEVPDAVPA